MGNMKILPKTLKGFRDFLPAEARKRQYVIDILRKVFESYGFEPLETPALEYEEILAGKYGDEGDRMMYKFEDKGGRKVALRYDQTVPLARVVAQYGNDISLPFKRYQIQNVWRGENPQAGRFREFLQCDIDTVGTSSLLADAEIIQLVYDAYKKLGLDVVIKINDRKLLPQISFKSLAVLDKLNKIGEEGVLKELQETGLSSEESRKLLGDTKALKASVDILRIREILKENGYSESIIEPSPTLIRGLDYYTGLIFEVVSSKDKSGLSLGGGGRYDDLIGMFLNQTVPAVGFSFGFDRVIEAMEKQNLFPDELSTTKVLITVFSEELSEKSIEVSSALRSKGINTEVYLDAKTKMDKQLKYADQKGIPYVVIIGPKEAEENSATLKNMQTGEQKTLPLDQLSESLK